LYRRDHQQRQSHAATGLIEEISPTLPPIADGVVNTPTMFDRLSGSSKQLS
jgi:hypothetical protein